MAKKTDTPTDKKQTPEATTSTEAVKKVTSKEETLILKESEAAIKLKKGKGGLVKILKEDFDKYQDKFEIVEEGKKK